MNRGFRTDHNYALNEPLEVGCGFESRRCNKECYMNKAEQVLIKLKELKNNDDNECAHSMADDLLCELLLELGYEEIVSVYEDLEKWYA